MLGLGIDTGGTYTDAVLFDLSRRAPEAWAKSLTTREDLSRGIRGALSALPAGELSRVELVSLSTTLATNACVENQGGRAGLILIGYNPALVEQLASGYGLDLVGRIRHVPGCHTQRGELAQPLDEGALRAAFEQLSGQVDAIGVCEYWGVRNPAIEQRAVELLSEGKTNLCVGTKRGQIYELDIQAAQACPKKHDPLLDLARTTGQLVEK